MGCVSSDQFQHLEQRVRRLEQALEQPNAYTEQQLVQAVSQKYGEASEQLIRLQNLIQNINNSEQLLSVGETNLKKAQDLSAMQRLSQGETFTAKKFSFICFGLHGNDRLKITRNNQTYSLSNTAHYANHMGSVTHLMSPGDSVLWEPRMAFEKERPADISFCYIIEL